MRVTAHTTIWGSQLTQPCEGHSSHNHMRVTAHTTIWGSQLTQPCEGHSSHNHISVEESLYRLLQLNLWWPQGRRRGKYKASGFTTGGVKSSLTQIPKYLNWGTSSGNDQGQLRPLSGTADQHGLETEMVGVLHAMCFWILNQCVHIPYIAL